MKCPYCNHAETKVVDKRDTESLEITRRRRECLGCNKRFTTYERVETVPLFILKKDGTSQSFERSKVLKGLTRACEKRPITPEQINQITDAIETELRNQTSTEIKARFVGELIMKKLKKLDNVAYIRFASVYQDFKDLSDFEKEVDKLMKKKK